MNYTYNTLLIPLLATKFFIPPLRADGVPRPRLTGRLQEALNRPGSVALLSGPAGFGKTTLLSEFVAGLRRPAAWLSLDDGDNDPIRFWTYLVTACQKIQEGLAASAQALLSLPQAPVNDVIPTILINDLAALNSRLVLILDDLHTIDNPAIHAGMSFLLDHLPGNLHLVASTRVDPPWPLARLRARNRLVEIRARDLRFTTEEAANFLNHTSGLDLSAWDVAALEARTEGWIAGLQLAAISMQGRADLEGFIRAFTGSHVYVAEYLLEEVLQRQPEEVQSFLMQTSILDRLCAGLCDAITRGSTSQARLTALQRANLFVLPLDDDGSWFRYHHLFADLLQARLRQVFPASEIAVLHRRAASWYESAGMAAKAVEHMLAAADYPGALRLIEPLALPMILQAYIKTLEGWLDAIPAAEIQRSPRANLARAWMNMLRGAYPQAAPYLERLDIFFSSPQAGEADPLLRAEWLTLQSEASNRRGRAAESRELACQALGLLPESASPVRSLALVNLATASQQLLDFDRAAEAYEIIAREARASGDFTSETLGASGQGQMLLQMGHLRQVYEIASEAIAHLETSGRITPFSATLYGELGQINYYWHRLEAAEHYFQQSIQHSGHSGYSDPEIFHHIVLSRIAQARGDWDAAESEMDCAGELARRTPPAMVREEIISQQARVDLAFGRIATAQASLQPEGYSFEGQFTYPELQPGRVITRPAGLLYNSALRVLLTQAREAGSRSLLQQGIELAGGLLIRELTSRQVPIALETLLLRSQMHAVLDDRAASRADLVQALELAEPEGFISIFVEEGPPVAEVLEDLLRDGLPAGTTTGYAQDVLAAFPGHAPAPQLSSAAAQQRSSILDLTTSLQAAPPSLPEPRPTQPTEAGEPLELLQPLTHRELEVLALIAQGDSNQAIADKLYITVSAVKKHTGRIYAKLNVASRTQALALARRLGWIE